MARSHHLFFTQRLKLSKRKKRQALDNIMLVMSFIYPLSGVPQALDVWQGDGKASLITWTMFLSFGFLSLAYGIAHKLKPIIINNIIWTVIDLSIIIGILRS